MTLGCGFPAWEVGKTWGSPPAPQAVEGRVFSPAASGGGELAPFPHLRSWQNMQVPPTPLPKQGSALIASQMGKGCMLPPSAGGRREHAPFPHSGSRQNVWFPSSAS